MQGRDSVSVSVSGLIYIRVAGEGGSPAAKATCRGSRCSIRG